MLFNLELSLQVLERTPGVLRSMLAGLGDEWIRADEGPDTFSPFDVLGHLIDGEETDWIARARIILAQGADTVFVPYDRFRHYERNKGRTLESLLDEFASLRAANIELVRSWRLGDAELDLVGTHPAFGGVTLRQLLATWTVHDLGHIAQAARVMAKQYREQVGPWEQYLPIVADRTPPRA